MTPKHIVSWNVNGLRAALKKGLPEFLEKTGADVVCLQETKIPGDLTPRFVFDDFPYAFWNCAGKKGYSGTAILSRHEPVNVSYGMGLPKHDEEGRVIKAEFDAFFLVTVYTPNSQNHDENRRPRRLDYRTLEWDVAFLEYLRSLEAKKPVVFCGDLNVAHREIDLANPKANRRNAGFTDEERERFSKLLDAGFVDSFRHLYPDAAGCYTWWSYRSGARRRNVGWRIDYFCLSGVLANRIKEARILDQIEGSDHCPIELVLD